MGCSAVGKHCGFRLVSGHYHACKDIEAMSDSSCKLLHPRVMSKADNVVVLAAQLVPV